MQSFRDRFRLSPAWGFRAALTLLTITAISGCTGTGGVTPAAPPPMPNGQAILGWGGNTGGQLGDGTTSQRLNPVTVPLRDLRYIAAGGDFSLGLTMDGRVWEWGGGRSAPTEITGLGSVKAIAVGERHRLALKDDGTVWAWGENDRGQLGDGSKTTRPTPVQVVGLTGVLSIAAGSRHSLAIGNGFSVLAWGANDAAQLGDGSTTDRLSPVPVPGVTAIALAASASHSVALTTDAKVVGWGSNSECQLGVDPRNDPFDPIKCSDHPTPTELLPWSAGGTRAATWGQTIAASNTATFVVTSDSLVVGFGGTGDVTQQRGLCNTDLVIGGATLILPHVKEVAAGPTHALFLTSSGGVWSLGSNLAGQVGLGTTSIQECPQQIPSARVRGATQVVAGAEHSLALVLGILDAQPATLDFGNQPVGTISTGAVGATVTNTGLASVTFSDIAVTGSQEFTVTENCPDKPAVLAAGSSCQIQAAFTPDTTGVRSGKILVRSDGKDQQREIALTGIGTEASAALAPATVNFGNQASGASSQPLAITVSNGGAAPLLISGITTTAGFSIQSDNCPRAPTPLSAPPTCTINVVFTPTAAGPAVGEVSVTYEPNKIATAQVRGNGI